MIEVLTETGSTNADLAARLRAGEILPDGFWLVAERQTGGQGRQGRPWVSPVGNLYASTVVNIVAGDPSPAGLSFVAALALFDTLEPCLQPGTSLLIKWPNDVLVNEAKIAGILLEREGQGVVIGIGVNVAHSPDLPDRKTTSVLEANGGYDGDCRTVMASLAKNFMKRLADWREKPLAATLQEWIIRSHRFGDRLQVSLPDGTVISGTYRGLDRDGALLLQTSGEGIRAIHAGDVMLV